VGRGYEFTAITAVVLGGVALGGGRGWVLSAAAGAFALESLFTLLNFMGVQATWRDTVQGAIIIVAVAAASRSWQRKRKGATASAHDEQHQLAATPTPAEGTEPNKEEKESDAQ
jgi:ribose transport system permease protein